MVCIVIGDYCNHSGMDYCGTANQLRVTWDRDRGEFEFPYLRLFISILLTLNILC